MSTTGDDYSSEEYESSEDVSGSQKQADYDEAANASAVIPDCHPLALVEIQPLRAITTLLGVTPSNSLLYFGYQIVVFLLCLGHPVILFLCIGMEELQRGQKFTTSTLGGMAAISLASPMMFWFVAYYFRDRKFKHASDVLLALDATDEREKAVRLMAVLYSSIGALFAVAFSVFWIVMFIFGLEKNSSADKDTLLILHSICAPFNISVFVLAATMLAIITNLHRDQTSAFLEGLLSKRISMRQAAYFYKEMDGSLQRSNAETSWWTAPMLSTLLFAMMFQAYGYFDEERTADQYNGLYYIVVTVLSLMVFALFTSSVTRKFRMLSVHAVKLYGVYDSSDWPEVSPFVQLLGLYQPYFRVAGAPALPEISLTFTLIIMGLSGMFLRMIVSEGFENV